MDLPLTKCSVWVMLLDKCFKLTYISAQFERGVDPMTVFLDSCQLCVQL
jgi:hypothetical protein